MAQRYTAGSEGRTVPLKQAPDYQVAGDSPDVRGWQAVSSDDRKIGRVDDLLVDTEMMKARYLLIDADDGSGRSGRQVAVPVARARLDNRHKRVDVGMPYEELAGLPAYTGTSSHDLDERFAGRTIDERGASAAESDQARFTRSAEELRIGRREVPAGEVRVSKHVETEHVSEPVTRMREDVRVERRPVSGRQSGPAELRDDEVRVPIVEEEIVTEKRPVVKEELVVAKDRVEETENVEADLRRERVNVERMGRPIDEDTSRRRR